MLNIPLFGQYMPHGYCYLWKPSLVGLHLVSDTLIGLAYYSIPITLLRFLKKRHDVPFYGIFLLFAAFIIFCGTTHFVETWTLWHSDYWASGILKAMTAGISVYTAIALIPVVPKALDLRTPAELEALNQQLQQEVAERRQTEAELQELSTRLDIALEAVGIGIWDWDIIHNTLAWDQRLYELYGTTPETFEGNYDAWARRVHPDDRPTAEAAIQRALRNEAVYDIEFRVIHTDNTVWYMKADGLVQWDDQGNPIRMIGTNHDITERKEAEHRLKVAKEEAAQKEALFRNTFEQAAVGIGHVSPNGKLLRVNQRYCDIVGHPKSDLLNLTFQDITHPEDLDADVAQVKQLLAGQIKTFDMEKRYIQKDGTVTWAHLTCSIIRGQGSNPDYLLGVLEDINARKKTEEMLRLYERAICTTPDHMSFVDRNYIYSMVNDVYATKFGKSKVDIIGHSVAELLGEDIFLQTIKPNLDRTFAGEKVHYQSLFSLQKGIQQYLDVSYTPYREVDGTVTGAVVSVRDISDIYAAERTLTHQTRRAEALLDLPQLAEQLDEHDFMRQAQEIAKTLTESQIVFLYIVHEDEATFERINELQEPLTTFGHAVSETRLPIDQAGILADILHQRKPVLCNCACGPSLHEEGFLKQQGLLKEHETLNRLLSVPVMENGKVVMLTGVANKSSNYTDLDIETVQLIFNLVWRTIQHYRALQTSRLLAAVVESTNDAIITNDVNGTITSWNVGAEKLLGYSASEVIGQSITMLFTKTEGVAKVTQILEELKQGKNIDQLETVQHHKDGTPLHVSITISPLKDRTDQVIGSSAIMRNISVRIMTEQVLNAEIRERQRAIRTLQLTTKQLADSNQELQDFAYVASHDLQEPLRKVQVFGDRLSQTCQNELSEKGQDYLARMLNAAIRAQTLINDLLSFSRVTTQAKPFTQTDLNQVMAGVLSDLEVRIAQTGATIAVDPLPTIDADPTQMRQVFQNLLGNALKFHTPGVAPQIQVNVQCYSLKGQEVCELKVIDNGIGFDVKYCDRIFQPFQRLHGRKTYEGSGIGLAICRKVTHRHGGTLRAESQPGQGATFIATLPVHHSHGGEYALQTD